MPAPGLCSFAAVVFDVIVDNADSLVPQWEVKSNVSVRHVVGANRDDVQFGGQANPTLTGLKIWLTNDTAIFTLRAAIGVPGTLVLPSLTIPPGTIASAVLTEVGQPLRYTSTDGSLWEVPVSFMNLL
ncbi:MAG TPA: hypothetical protein VIU62_02970 [Chloroflexota bacterium]